jgi:hypothetical protein
MKDFYLWMILLFFASCGNNKADLVEQQRKVDKQIQVTKTLLDGQVYLQNEYINKWDKTGDLDKQSEIKKDSLMRWSVYTNGLRTELDSLKAVYDSLQWEIKKY